MQGLGAHVAPAPSHFLGAEQDASRLAVHTPIVSQHAPGCGQGFGVHDVPAPCQTPGAEHVACRVARQVPAVLQQAPV
jgi:hypothetical protein